MNHTRGTDNEKLKKIGCIKYWTIGPWGKKNLHIKRNVNEQELLNTDDESEGTAKDVVEYRWQIRMEIIQFDVMIVDSVGDTDSEFSNFFLFFEYFDETKLLKDEKSYLNKHNINIENQA